MKVIRSLEFHIGSKEEKLPGFTAAFPYIASRAELDYYRESFVPWHWHKAVELFYVESGELSYHTPNGCYTFPAGSGGMINSNVLHMTRFEPRHKKNIQLLHIFEPDLISGKCGSLIEQTYVLPLTMASWLEILPLSPDIPEQAEILSSIRRAFQLSEQEFGYELKVRNALSDIWLRLFRPCLPRLHESAGTYDHSTDKIKSMMIYIHEHYPEKISIAQLAAAAFLSERDCYRVFRKYLHMSPLEYMKSYRLQMACQMLAEGQAPVTEVGHACGLGNSSYFGKFFHENMGCTPSEYRKKWQDCDRS